MRLWRESSGASISTMLPTALAALLLAVQFLDARSVVILSRSIRITDTESPDSVQTAASTSRNSASTTAVSEWYSCNTTEPKSNSSKPKDSGSDRTTMSLYEDGIIVRKCCPTNEFISFETSKCETSEEDPGFGDMVRSLLTEGTESSLEYETGNVDVEICDVRGIPLSFDFYVSSDSYSILPAGYLKQHTSGTIYDHDHYCLEVAADGSANPESALLMTIVCPPSPAEVVIRKCCEEDQYYDSALRDCQLLGTVSLSDVDSLVSEFSGHPNNSVSSKGKLTCETGEYIMLKDKSYVSADGQLCDTCSGHCYSMSDYCIDYQGAQADTNMTPVAMVCPPRTIYKCCNSDELLTDTGCVSSRHAPSAHMSHLLESSVEPRYGFPRLGCEEQCVQAMVDADDEDLHWWIRPPYLTVRSKANNRKFDTMHFCVDDYGNSPDQTSVAIRTCRGELESITFVSLSAELNEVGKCCPLGEYFNLDLVCVPGNLESDLISESVLQEVNVTSLKYTSFLGCHTNEGESKPNYFQYDLVREAEYDHVVIKEDLSADIVSVGGKCVFRKQRIERQEYCIEHMKEVEGRVRPVVVTCKNYQTGPNVHLEKWKLVPVLLGISCAALLASAYTIISTHVRRGSISVKKVNTLNGKLMLSYVLSNFLGFIVLGINTLVVVKTGSTGCRVIAGLSIFFLLAAFHWNTSICLEILLLTIGVRTSEKWRYLFHSVWAGGGPGFITALVFILDAHRDSLPCWVITPKIGLEKCFFSDRRAKMAYFYVPMFLSLCANIVLLVLARYLRYIRIKRLERGLTPTCSSGNQTTTVQEAANHNNNNNNNNNNVTPNHSPTARISGLRIHQNHNLWSESMKLVLWSGVTWLLEVVSTLIDYTPSENWYDYLWYLPTSINALRGVGIFYIVVLTPENRKKWLGTLRKLNLPHLGSKSMNRSGQGMSAGNSRCSTLARGTTTSEVLVNSRRSSMSIEASELEGLELDSKSSPGDMQSHRRETVA